MVHIPVAASDDGAERPARGAIATPVAQAADAIPDPAQLIDSLAVVVAGTLGHRFAERGLLVRACTHSSHPGLAAAVATTGAAPGKSTNERFEFLGDALLGAALALLIHERFPEADEGRLSRMKSHLVSRATLARAGDAAGIIARCFVGAQMGSQWPDSVKANLVEALLAAIYFDGGWPALVEAVRRLLANRIEDPDAAREDERMQLQVWCLEHHQRLPEYTSARDGGTDHQPEFSAIATIGGQSAEGRGSSRRRAEAAAAGNLIAKLREKV